MNFHSVVCSSGVVVVLIISTSTKNLRITIINVNTVVNTHATCN